MRASIFIISFYLWQVASLIGQNLVPFGLNPDGVSHLYWPYDEVGRRDKYQANYGASWCEGEGCQRGIELENIIEGHWSVSCNAVKSFCPAHLKGDKYAQDWLRQPNPAEGHSIFAPMASKVVYIGNAEANYGKWILLQSYQNTSLYMFIAHMASINVSVGTYLCPREKIGIVGKTGNGANNVPHAHIALYRNIDPSILYNSTNGTWTTPQDEKHAAKFLFDADTRKICMPDGPSGSYSYINTQTIPNFKDSEIHVLDDKLITEGDLPKSGMGSQHVTIYVDARLGIDTKVVSKGESSVTFKPANKSSCPNNSYASEPNTENRSINNDLSLFVNEDAKYSDFTAYPNPTENMLTIESKGNTMDEIAIMNLDGGNLSRIDIDKAYEFTLNIDDILKDKVGMFLLSVRFYDGTIKIQKIIKI